MENTKNKSFTHFKLHTVLSSVMESCHPALSHLKHESSIPLPRVSQLCMSSACYSLSTIGCETERECSLKTFTTMYCFNCYILLLVIINLLLCLIYKLNSTQVCMHRKKHSIYGVWYYLKFQVSTGDLGMYLPQMRGRDYYGDKLNLLISYILIIVIILIYKYTTFL